uniref:Mast cell protease 3-like n=1 Tax=Pelodiscus sinensis TaxID=13735 RepID=K7FLH8_PELSI
IVGGREARPHSRPYMALVNLVKERKAHGICGGFLIQEDVVLTAAHCNCDVGNLTVLLGAHNVSRKEQGTQEIGVRRRIPHPKFIDATLENDLMLLQLQRQAELTTAVGTIALSGNKVKRGAVCSVAGWGQTNFKINGSTSPTLQEVDLTVMNRNMCLSCNYLPFVPSRMLCVGDPEGRKTPFLGDSGGPLVCDGKAQGIVSYGSANGSTPSVFTKLSKYLCWIQKTQHHLA